jgi:hypothetical protein
MKYGYEDNLWPERPDSAFFGDWHSRDVSTPFVAFAPTALNMTEGEGLEKLRVPSITAAESLLHARRKHASLNSPRVLHLDKDMIVARPRETIRE